MAVSDNGVPDSAHAADPWPSIQLRIEGSRSGVRRGRQYAARLRARWQALEGEVKGEPLSRVAAHVLRWVTDNEHILRASLHQIDDGLPAAYLKKLPYSETPQPQKNKRGTPLVFPLIARYVDALHGPIDPHLLVTAVNELQAERPWQLCELWALPIVLRIIVFDRLMTLAEQTLGVAADDESEHLRIDDQLSACVLSLRVLETIDWRDFVEQVSLVEEKLRADPAGVYPRMDAETRNRYRERVEGFAGETHRDEWQVAEQAVSLAREAGPRSNAQHHVGYYLRAPGSDALFAGLGCDPPWPRRISDSLERHLQVPYLLIIFLFPLTISALSLFRLRADGLGIVTASMFSAALFLILLSVSALLVNVLITSLRTPQGLPKMDFSKGVPAEFRTVVVIPALLSSKDILDELLLAIELHFLCARQCAAQFALLTDFSDAATETEPSDEHLLQAARSGIDRLNERYGEQSAPRFALLHRQRLWNARDQVWMGWERKRGKIEEFNEWLLGDDDTSLSLERGDLDQLRACRFAITLDADTRLLPDTAGRLIGALAHPLNRPRRANGQLIAGYSLIQPRVQVDPASASATLFARIANSDSGIDLYSNATSDLYQDLFGEGNYAGKGIYDIYSFAESLKRNIPANLVLSHDLLEGLYARAAMATDITVLESAPDNVLTFMRRMHRWVRGDWQLLRWALGRVPATSSSAQQRFRPGVIGRWKLIDNLRRSLFAPLQIMLLLMIWLLPISNAVGWTLLVLSNGPVQVALGLIDPLRYGRFVRGSALDTLWRSVSGALRAMIEWLHRLALLPYEALTVADAITRSLYRQAFSKKNLLEWKTAAESSRSHAQPDLPGIVRALWFPGALTVALSGWLYTTTPSMLLVASPVLLLWLMAPFIAWLGAHERRDRESISDATKTRCRRLARETWRYFEEQVTPETHWLPPDNVQYLRRREVAYRTSPTNIGMYLVGVITAQRLGFISLVDQLTRLSDSLATLARLPGHRGHLFNWYDINALTPLEPHYVSTVDSGNFVASLITCRAAITDVTQTLWDSEVAIKGLQATLGAFLDHWRELPLAASGAPVSMALEAALRSLSPHRRQSTPDKTLERLQSTFLVRIERAVIACTSDPQANLDTLEIDNIRIWLGQVTTQTAALRDEHRRLFGWCDLFTSPPDCRWEGRALASLRRLQRLAGLAWRIERLPRVAATALRLLHRMQSDGCEKEAVRQWLEACRVALHDCATTSKDLLSRVESLDSELDRWIEATEFGFLFDQDRELFHIGFDVSNGELDRSYYDLLASEARLASIVAIAKSQVPTSHWLHLGRPIVRVRSARLLLSWSGTLFEYLMPSLFIRSQKYGLLRHGERQAISEQRRYCRKHNAPWGISESAYHVTDASGVYQYRAFGITALSLSGYQQSRLVIAPYASVLALPFVGDDIQANFDAFDRRHMHGRYGYYEALDYGIDDRRPGRAPRVVRAYMAHHQGMILAALGNAVLDELLVRCFQRDSRIATVNYLLGEALPGASAVEKARSAPKRPVRPADTLQAELEGWPCEASDELLALSNGRMTSVLTGSAAGALRWHSTALTRDRFAEDGPQAGSEVWLREIRTDRVWRFGTTAPDAARRIEFAPHYAMIREEFEHLTVRMRVSIAHDVDAELRKFTITNHQAQDRKIEICCASQVCLQSKDSFERHPVFQKLFVSSVQEPALRAQIFFRRPVAPDEHPLYLGQLVNLPVEAGVGYRVLSDWGRFRGRLNPDIPDGFSATAGQTSDSSDTRSIDPAMCAILTLRIPARQTVQFSLITMLAQSKAQLYREMRLFLAPERVVWTESQSRQHSSHDLHQLKATPETWRQAMTLYADLLWQETGAYPEPLPGASNRIRQSLWKYGISGDLPMVGLRITDASAMRGIDDYLQMWRCLRFANVAFDLLLFDESHSGYMQPVWHLLGSLIDSARTLDHSDASGGIFRLAVRDMSDEDVKNLQHACTPLLDEALEYARQRSLHHDLPFVPQQASIPDRSADRGLTPMETLEHRNRYGGYDADTEEYVIDITPAAPTPRPWGNVLANPQFGSMLTESGIGFSWANNSHENRLTPWYNDPVGDRCGEAVYIRDEETAEFWSPTALPAGNGGGFRIRHGAGYSRYEHACNGILQQLTVFVDAELPCKVVKLTLINQRAAPRRLTVTGAFEWALGNRRVAGGRFIEQEVLDDDRGFVLRALNTSSDDPHCAFLSVDHKLHGFCMSRSEFTGPNNDWAQPRGLKKIGLSSDRRQSSSGFTAAMMHFDLAPNATCTCQFVIGSAETTVEAAQLARKTADAAFTTERFTRLRQHWHSLLNQCRITTPEPTLDTMVNHWSLYQSLSSRLWGRAGFYQTGGGFGFRDQLQDVLALIDVHPTLVRQQIILAASRQFTEGDVLHWWHERPLRGVRTRCSDDLLWLPYVVAHYMKVSADDDFLDVMVPYLEGEPLADDEHERYAEFSPSSTSESVFAHCCRAIDARLGVGRNGLPLIGTGDWNDGFSRVGIHGEGESVWLAWFLVDVCREFAMICETRGERVREETYRSHAIKLQDAVAANAWDGQWYRRGYFDDGSPLGSQLSDECKIDLNAQSWAILAAEKVLPRHRTALASVVQRLADRDEETLKLLSPPFARSEQDPGYIRGYPAGVRENGGQYSHAAVWAAWACATAGDADRALRWAQWINPLYRARDASALDRYGCEPYVIAADIYSGGQLAGRGGWSWYTGAAAWWRRLVLEQLLGLQRRGQQLFIRPIVPDRWERFSVVYRFNEAEYRIDVEQPARVRELGARIEIDGQVIAGSSVPLAVTGEHHVVVTPRDGPH